MLREGDPQQALIVAGLDTLLVEGQRQRQLETEWPLADLGHVVDAVRPRAGQVALALDDDGILKEDHLELLLIDAGQLDDDLDGSADSQTSAAGRQNCWAKRTPDWTVASARGSPKARSWLSVSRSA